MSWPRRARNFWRDLFGSRLILLLERDLLQARMERDRAQSELKAAQERLLEVMAATKGIPWRAPMAQDKAPAKATAIPPTQWQRIQAQAIEENARLEAEDAKKNEIAAAKEN